LNHNIDESFTFADQHSNLYDSNGEKIYAGFNSIYNEYLPTEYILKLNTKSNTYDSYSYNQPNYVQSIIDHDDPVKIYAPDFRNTHINNDFSPNDPLI
jgi:hypothetical protein